MKAEEFYKQRSNSIRELWALSPKQIEYIGLIMEEYAALRQPPVSVVREPVVLGAVCPHFDTCQNGGKNKFCDLQTFKELDCFVGQTER